LHELATNAYNPQFHTIMGQQLRVTAKRRRRAAYNERKKEAAKAAAKSKGKK